jgi:hypothetical protein
VPSNYIFCSSYGFRVHEKICAVCINKKCKIYRERIRNKKRKEIERTEIEDGITRSLLLKPEDVVNQDKTNDKRKRRKRKKSKVGKVS